MTSLRHLSNPLGPSFAFLDSGAPATPLYTTIIAVHGIGFNASIFQKVIDLANSSSIRLVAVNRRGYPGSAPLTPEDIALLSGTDEEKNKYNTDRGAELLAFIDQFIQEENVPAVSEDGKTGGVAFLGWSFGNAFAVSALAHVETLGKDAQARLAKYLRALILEDPPFAAFGMEAPPSQWLPATDESIPTMERLPFNFTWLSFYFDQAEGLAKRDANLLTYASPSTAKVPSIFSMHSQLPSLLDIPAFLAVDRPHLLGIGTSSQEFYKRVLFGKTLKEVLPHLRITHLGRAQSASFGIVTFWNVQDDDARHGGGNVRSVMNEGTNHFAHWDYPELALSSWIKAVD